jgi:hypothetical protein
MAKSSGSHSTPELSPSDVLVRRSRGAARRSYFREDDELVLWCPRCRFARGSSSGAGAAADDDDDDATAGGGGWMADAVTVFVRR